MRKSSFVLGIVWVIIALFLTCYLVRGLNGLKNNFFNVSKISSKSEKSSELYESHSFDKQQLKKIGISVSSASVEINGTSDDKITVDLYGNWQPEYLPSITCDNKGFSLKMPKTNNMGLFFANNRKIIISIPSDCFTNETDIRIAYASGSISVNNVVSDNFIVSGASGSTRLNRINSNSITVEVASGSVKADDISTSFIKLNSASGSIKISGAFDGTDIHSASGSISIENKRCFTKDSQIESASGSIKLTIPKNSNFVLKCHSISGSIHNGFTGNTLHKSATEKVGNGGVNLTIDTTSGSIRIN